MGTCGHLCAPVFCKHTPVDAFSLRWERVYCQRKYSSIYLYCAFLLTRNFSKLACTRGPTNQCLRLEQVALSAATEHEGGALLCLVGGAVTACARELGSATVHGGDVCHAVTPVTVGTRYALLVTISTSLYFCFGTTTLSISVRAYILCGWAYWHGWGRFSSMKCREATWYRKLSNDAKGMPHHKNTIREFKCYDRTAHAWL